MIDQKFNVCIDGRRFSIQTSLKGRGHRRSLLGVFYLGCFISCMYSENLSFCFFFIGR